MFMYDIYFNMFKSMLNNFGNKLCDVFKMELNMFNFELNMFKPMMNTLVTARMISRNPNMFNIRLNNS